MLETGTNVEDAYQRNWKEFEAGFWEAEISVGRIRYPRSAILLNHWLIARTGEEVVARQVFNLFKGFADDAGLPMPNLLQQVHEAAGVYRRFITVASTHTGLSIGSGYSAIGPVYSKAKSLSHSCSVSSILRDHPFRTPS